MENNEIYENFWERKITETLLLVLAVLKREQKGLVYKKKNLISGRFWSWPVNRRIKIFQRHERIFSIIIGETPPLFFGLSLTL